MAQPTISEIAGNLTSLIIGTSPSQYVFHVHDVDLMDEVDDEDITVTSDGTEAVDQMIGTGVRRRTLTVSGPYDTAADYHKSGAAPAANIAPGTKVVGVHVGVSADLIYTADYKVKSWRVRGGPGQVVSKFEAVLKSTGAIAALPVLA